MGVQLTGEGEGDEQVIRAAVLFVEESALELRVFAAPRSGGLWDDVCPEIIDEVVHANGEYHDRDGPWGHELLARIPVTDSDGEDAVQPSRIIGIDGPRWFLRATVLGKQAVDLTDEGLLMDCLRDVVVRRGEAACMVREPLLLEVPEGAIHDNES